MELAFLLLMIKYVAKDPKFELSIDRILQNKALYGISDQDFKKALQKSKYHITKIQKELKKLQISLPTTKLTTEYIRGLHHADGSMTTTYALRQKCNISPTWTITADFSDIPLLLACKYTFGGKGSLNKVGKTGATQYVLGGRKNFHEFLIPLFSNQLMISPYKQQQWDRVFKAVQLMDSKKHGTLIGWTKLIDLTYDASYNHKRKYPKQYYLNPALIPKIR